MGKHQTENKLDDYLGSGVILRRAIEKYGAENFSKEILFECATPEEMNQKEADIVDEEFISRDDTYNIKLGGTGGWDYILSNKLGNVMTEKKLKSHISNMKVINDRRRILLDDEEYRKAWGEKISNAKKFYYLVNPSHWSGRKHTEETKEKIRVKRLGKVNGKNNPSFGKHWVTDGIVSKLVKKTEPIPAGFKKGRV